MLNIHRLTCVVLPCLCLLAAPTDGYLVASAPEQAFARAFNWSGFDRGHRVGVALGRTKMWYGQPLELTVAAPPVATASPEYRHVFLRVWWEDLNERIKKTATVELTDRRGNPVEYTLTVLSSADSISSGHRSVVRLTPKKKPGSSMYFPPGEYQLRVRVHMDEADADANSYVGTLVTPKVDLEIWSTEPEARDTRIAEYRAGVEKQFAGATTPEMRRALEYRLRHDLFDPQHTLMIPALETIAAGDDPAAATSAKRVLRNLLFPIVQINRPDVAFGNPSVIDAPTLGILGEPSWALIREIENGDALPVMRSKAARHGPLTPHVDLSEPTDEQVAALAKRLRDERFEMRMAALRGVGHTNDPRVIALLVERFNDPYSYILSGMPGMPVPTHPVAAMAAWQLTEIGEPAVAVLIEKTDQLDDRGRSMLEQTLVQIGPHNEVLSYFGRRLEANNGHQRHMAIYYLRQLGPPAARLLRPVAEDAAGNITVRKLALSALAEVDPSEATAKLLRQVLTDPKTDGATRATCMYGLVEVAPTPHTRKLLQAIADDPNDPLRETATQRIEALDRELRAKADR